MDNLIYVVVGLALLGLVWFFFLRKPADAELPETEKPSPLPKAKPDVAPLAKASAKSVEPKSSEPKPAAKTAPKVAPPEPEGADASPRPPRVDDDDDEPEAIPVVAAPSAKPPRPTSVAPTSKRTKDVAGLRRGLAKARESEGFFGRLKALIGGRKEIDPRIAEEIEEVLLTSDVGVKTTSLLVENIKGQLDKGELKDEAKVWEALRTKASEILDLGGGGIVLGHKPTVVMVVGVNGVGKTTTIGKLATRLVAQNKKVVLAAGDTFRAAAVQQLGVWAKRAGCEIVTGAEGANAGAVIFDAIQKAKEIGADVVLADTAGRLHTKTNLMDELKKIARTMGKALDGSPHETLLVLDATNGQNATQQAALFKEALPLSGIVLTKLDGTAKGGVILGICAEHEVPVRYIGVGERAEDLRDFDAEEFVEALLGSATETADRAA